MGRRFSELHQGIGKEEVMDAKWVNLDEYKKMLNNKEIVPILNFDENDFIKAINILNKEK